jgi:hypothetical protein
MLLFELLLDHLELLKFIKIFLRVKIDLFLSVSKLIKVHGIFVVLYFVSMTLLILIVLIHVIEC